jgi:hypothetical protein
MIHVYHSLGNATGSISDPRPSILPVERWLLFLHQLPAKPDYLRVKLWRRVQKLGAVPLKNSVWALPDSQVAMEDFQWLRREVESDGGEAVICRAEIVAGLQRGQRSALKAMAKRMKRQSVATHSESSRSESDDRALRGSTWVTRRGVGVDRLGSAWLIRRRIDPEAQFRFVADNYIAKTGEIRFDTYEGEYTHVGNQCTFEVLTDTFAPSDAALRAVAEIIHDIDLKDEQFGRPETVGVAALIDGICATQADDEARLERGFLLFDDLYAAFKAQESPE